MKGYGVTLRATVPGVSELVRLARETEDAGFSGVYIPEAVNDALMCSLAVAIATWIVNIYLREPGLCAIAAEMVQEAAQGRFILGLGASHRPVLEARGIEMGNARDRLRHVTEIIGKAFRGELEMFGRKFPAPSHPIPIAGPAGPPLSAAWVSEFIQRSDLFGETAVYLFLLAHA